MAPVPSLTALLLLGLQDPAAPARAEALSLVRVERALLTPERIARLDLDQAAVIGDGVELVCGARERAELERERIPYEVVHEDLAAFYASRLLPPQALRAPPPLGAWLSPPFGSGTMGGYYTFAEVASVLDQIHAAYPALTGAKFSLGTSHQGRALWALKVSDNPGSDEAEPEVRFDALHHAREPQSMQCTLWALLWLVENYGSEPLASYLVNERELWFVPVVNPDGYLYNQATNPAGGGLWRKNRRNNGDGTFGVDLNRNYSYQWGFDDAGSSPSTGSDVYRGPAPASEPEVAAMQAFSATRAFSTALSSHTYSDLWLAPWGYIDGAPANAAQYDELGILATEVNGYVHGPAGSVLYLANGVTIDHDQGARGTLSFTPEIGSDSDGFWPATSEIVPLAQENELGFLRTAWAAGAYVHALAQTASEVGDGDGFFESGEGLAVVFSVRNSGRAAATVELELACSTPGITVTTGLVSLGSLAPFTSDGNAGQPLELSIASVPPGTRVDYVASLRYQGFSQDSPGSFFVGQPRLALTDDLETDLGWTAGAPGDGATTGIWAYGNPVGTTSGGAPSNPEDDATPAPGLRCFATGNGSSTAGGDDVDGGPTTLVSPRLDLSGMSAATLSYERWFADATTLDDQLQVSLSDDDGATWTTLETVSGGSANAWHRSSFLVQDFVALTDQVRLRLVTGDSPNNSITEAGLDELALTTFTGGPLLNFYGSGALGSPLALHVSGASGQAYAVRASTNPANLPTSFGTILIKPSTSFLLARGSIPASGLARILITVPDTPALAGVTFYAQAATLPPLALSNRAQITFE